MCSLRPLLLSLPSLSLIMVGATKRHGGAIYAGAGAPNELKPCCGFTDVGEPSDEKISPVASVVRHDNATDMFQENRTSCERDRYMLSKRKDTVHRVFELRLR
jgi:hypothetical protein